MAKWVLLVLAWFCVTPGLAQANGTSVLLEEAQYIRQLFVAEFEEGLWTVARTSDPREVGSGARLAETYLFKATGSYRRSGSAVRMTFLQDHERDVRIFVKLKTPGIQVDEALINQLGGMMEQEFQALEIRGVKARVFYYTASDSGPEMILNLNLLNEAQRAGAIRVIREQLDILLNEGEMAFRAAGATLQ